jgi:hypothetical protein
MTPGLLLRLTDDALRPLIEADGGSLSVCSSPAHLLEILGNGPGRYRVLLLWEGSTALPDTRGCGQTGKIQVIVEAHRGLPAAGGRDAYRDRAGETPLLDRAETVCELVRAIEFTTEEGDPHGEIDCLGYVHESSAWLPLPDSLAREYAHTYTIRWAKGTLGADVTASVESNVAHLLRREVTSFAGAAVSHADIGTLYMVYKNGLAQSVTQAAIAGDTATFAQAPRAGDVVLLVGRG